VQHCSRAGQERSHEDARSNLSHLDVRCGCRSSSGSLAAGADRGHQKIIKIETDLLKLLKRQPALGQVAVADVQVQDAALAAAEQMLPPVDKSLAQQRDLLTALPGRYPTQEAHMGERGFLALAAIMIAWI